MEGIEPPVSLMVADTPQRLFHPNLAAHHPLACPMSSPDNVPPELLSCKYISRL
jgi:hypothetical protein